MSKSQETHTLVYPASELKPEDLLNFIELPWFTQEWESLKLTDKDLSALQILIMSDPRGGEVMQGAGGLRKLRYSPEAWNTGKSSALRVCYVFFEKYGVVLLAIVFRKKDLANLSPKGKRAVKAAIERSEKQLSKQFGF